MAKTDAFKLTELKRNVLQEILDACAIIDSKTKNELGIKDLYKGIEKWDVPELNYNSSNTTDDEFKSIVENSTGESSFRRAYAKVYEQWEQSKSPEYSETTMSGTPKPEVQANIPQKGVREVQEQERVQRENAIRAANEKGERETQELIERLKRRKVKILPKEKIPTITLSTKDKEEIYALGKAALIDPHTTQQTIESKINEAIKNSPEEVGKTIPKETISNCATDFTEKVSILGNYTSFSEIPNSIESLNESSTLTSLTNVDDEKLSKVIPDQKEREIIAKDAQDISLAIELNRNVNTSLLKPVLGSTVLTDLIYGPENITQYQILDGTEDLTEEQRKEEKEINVGELYDRASDVRNFWEKFSSGKSSVSETIIEESKLLPTYANYSDEFLSSSAKALLTDSLPTIGTFTGFGAGVLQSAWATSKIPVFANPSVYGALPGPVSGTFLSESAYVASNSLVVGTPFSFTAGNFGLNILTGSAGSQTFFGAQATLGGNSLRLIATKTASNVTFKLSANMAAKVGTTAITTVAGEGTAIVVGQLTVPIPVLGAIIGAVAGFIGPKAVGLIKDNALKIAKGAFAVVGGAAGLLLGGVTSGIIGAGAGFIVGSFVTGGVPSIQSSVSSFTSGASAVGGFVWQTFMAGVGTPILVTLLAFPVVVALILFIINSGAYVVPPGTGPGSKFAGPGSFSSPYIDIVKTPDSTGPFSNSDLPKKIKYTVTIKAKKGTLMNIKITDDCQVVSKTQTKCPTYSLPDDLPNMVNPASSQTFTYDMTIGKEYSNTTILNNINVTADISNQNGITATGGNSITIGNPPVSCPVIGGHVARADLNYSYNATNDTGHGSGKYWASGMSHYPIPQSSGCNSPKDCSYYGYAYDVFPSGSKDVFAPTVLGKDMAWNCSYAFSNGGGSVGYTYHCMSADGNNMLVLTHMNKNVKTGTIKSGEKIGTLFNQGTNTHLHLEFQLNGRYVKPENYFCGGK